MKVFVTGATGLIGNAVARALRRAGHTVYGLVRTEEKAKKLREHEIIPVLGDLLSIGSFTDILASCGAIIHTAFDYTTFPASDLAVVDTVLNKVKYSSTQRPVFIYTSGVLIVPDRIAHPAYADDYTTPNNPLLSGRIETEKLVIASSAVHGVVLRPGFVYGNGSSYLNNLFDQVAKNTEIKVPAAIHTYPLVHVEDLAEAYVKAAENPNASSGHIFNIGDDNRTNQLEIAKAVAKAAGFTGPVVADDTNLWPPANKTCYVDWRKAARILNWYPRHIPPQDEMGLYYEVYKATH